MTFSVAECSRRLHVLQGHLTEATLYIGITDIRHCSWTHDTDWLRDTFNKDRRRVRGKDSSISKIGWKNRFLVSNDIFFSRWRRIHPGIGTKIYTMRKRRIGRIAIAWSIHVKVTGLLKRIEQTLLDISNSVANNKVITILISFQNDALHVSIAVSSQHWT